MYMLPNDVKVIRACVNSKWYYRLYVKMEMIKDFETIEELYHYVKENHTENELSI